MNRTCCTSTAVRTVGTPLGTDQLGRCVLSRLIYGARYSLGISLPVVALLGAIGIVAGCFSACAPRAIQTALRYVCDVLIAFPAVVLAAAFTGVAGNGIATLVVSVVVSMWAWFVRMAGAYARVEMGKGYALASQIAGCGTPGLVFKHIMPNILPQTGFAALDIRFRRRYGREKAASVRPLLPHTSFCCLHPWRTFTQNSG